MSGLLIFNGAIPDVSMFVLSVSWFAPMVMFEQSISEIEWSKVLPSWAFLICFKSVLLVGIGVRFKVRS